MTIAVQSYPELYTLLLGWNLYDQLWDILSQTGLAYLPFIGIVLRNLTQPYLSQETKDASSTSLRRMEVDFITTLLLIFFAVSPAFSLNPALVSYTPLCPISGKNPQTVHPGDTGTTYDQAFAVPTTPTTVPIWWYAVIALSEGMTSAANTLVSCVPDLRSMITQVDLAQVSDPELKRQVRAFEENCFIPARTQYLADTQNNPNTRSLIQNLTEQYGSTDTDWVGSHAFEQTYYQTLKAAQPVPGFPYDPSQDLNANNANPPAYGTPTCAQWWNDPQTGLKIRLQGTLSNDFWDTYTNTLNDPQTQDDLLKRVIFNNTQTGYDKANAMVGDVGYSHLAAGLGEWFQQLDTYPKLYAAAQAAPIIQALLLLMVYAFLPIVLVFTGYQPKAFITGGVIIFSLVFWSFIWHLVSWTDSALMNALYGNSWFSHQSPNATLVDMITGTLIIVAPLFWFSFMGSMGIKVGDLAHRAAANLGVVGDQAAHNGVQAIKNGLRKL